eukprot:gene985-38387_t
MVAARCAAAASAPCNAVARRAARDGDTEDERRRKRGGVTWGLFG